MTAEQRQRLEAQMQRTQMSNVSDREKLLNSVLSNKKLIYVIESFLGNNLKRNNDKLAHVMSNWNENDYQHLKFISLYDKTPKVTYEPFYSFIYND